jgi:ABC-2 type transport system ATP-binding protein
MKTRPAPTTAAAARKAEPTTRSKRKKGRTVLLASHLLGEIAQTVDQVVVVARGRLRLIAAFAELTERGRTLEEVYLEVTAGAGA